MLLVTLLLAGLERPGTILSRRSAVTAFSTALCAGVACPPARAGLLGPFPGEQPTDLGVRPDGSLKACPSSPNCWSTSGDDAHRVKPFEYSKSKDAAVADLLDVLQTYPQGGIKKDGGVIDGGGNKIIDSKDGYVYMQFTSKKFGFVDDVEFSVDGGKVAIRSASRQGDSDLGVNRARLEYIASALASKGSWKTDLF